PDPSSALTNVRFRVKRTCCCRREKYALRCVSVLLNVRHGLTTSHLRSLKSPLQMQQQQQPALLGCFVKEKDNDQQSQTCPHCHSCGAECCIARARSGRRPRTGDGVTARSPGYARCSEGGCDSRLQY